MILIDKYHSVLWAYITLMDASFSVNVFDIDIKWWVILHMDKYCLYIISIYVLWLLSDLLLHISIENVYISW